MRKRNVFALLLIIALLLAACTPAIPEKSTSEPTQTQPPTEPEPELSLVVLQINGGCYPTLGGNHTYDYEYWTEHTLSVRNRPEAPRAMTITFNGRKYTGTYDGSSVRAPNTYATDHYTTNAYEIENGIFYVNSETEQVVFFQLFGKSENGTLTESECEAIAREFVSQYADLSQYTLEVSSKYDYYASKYYTFEYARYLDGVKTNDSYCVDVSTSGKIRYFLSYGGGSFSDEQLSLTGKTLARQLELLQSEQAQTALIGKIETIFKDFHTVYPDPEAIYKYAIQPQYLVILPDDTLGMYYRVVAEARVPTESGSTNVTSAVLQLVVKCQPSDLPMPESDPPENMPARIATGKDVATGVSLEAYRLTQLVVDGTQYYSDEYGFMPEGTFQRVSNQDISVLTRPNPFSYDSDSTGWYSGSWKFPQEDRMIDVYNNDDWSISMDSKTGELMAVQCTHRHAGQETVESCRDKADSIAGEFGDLSQWEQSRSAVGDLYRYVYYRYVPEEQVCHWMAVTLDSAGGLYSFFRGSLALPEGTEGTYLPQMQALLSDQAYALFAEKQQEAADILIDYSLAIYARINYKNTPLPAREAFRKSCAVFSMNLLVLPDGTLGALYITDTAVTRNDYTNSDGINFLVKCV